MQQGYRASLKPVTANQIYWLEKLGYAKKMPETAQQADQVIKHLLDRRRQSQQNTAEGF